MSEMQMNTEQNFPISAASLLPHRPPMLLINNLTERVENTAKADATMPAEGIFFDTESAFPEFYIEIMAQAVAASKGYDALIAQEKMLDGMIVGVDSFSFFKMADPGTHLEISIEMTFEFGAVKIIHGTIHDQKTLLAEGVIKVWENQTDQPS